jgi:parallel beta-helix repeat protein
MKTEISRHSHRPGKRFTGVYQQQGRMLTDADWNEMVEVFKGQLDDALKDIVGFVDKDGKSSRGGMPRHRALEITQSAQDDPISIQPGRIYVDGLAGEVIGEDSISLAEQTDFPFEDTLPDPTGNYIVYADLWERTVTALEDRRLLDPALHGADTCSRRQAMLQIKWCESGAGSDDPQNIVHNPTIGNARATVRLREDATVDDPCDPCAAEVAVDSNVGNYLFRVEVHDVQYNTHRPRQGYNKIVLKWSSENGAEQYCRTDSEGIEIDIPLTFKDGEWVFEFFNEETEKHLGVQLPGGINAVRKDLQKGYPLVPPSVEDCPYVRRWDGCCTLSWNSERKTWRVDDAWSRGVNLVASGRTGDVMAGKQLTLNELLFEMQLQTLVEGNTVTDSVLAGTDLLIEGSPIVSADASAKEKASAINATTAITGVIASAVTRAKGIAVEDVGEIADGDLLINGANLGVISEAANQQAQADAIVDAINAASLSVEAAKNPQGAIVLTAADGRDINLVVANVDVAKRCGFADGTSTFRGAITLVSADNSAIEITGDNPQYAGFEDYVGTGKNAVQPVQFVAGDFWLAEIRDEVFRAELEKLNNAETANASYEIPPVLDSSAPLGIEHHYLQLGEVESGKLLDNQEKDRKYAFPPLTEMTRMFHVVGDGQEAMPGDLLPQTLEVGVANGEWPVAGAAVMFWVEHGNGSISSSAADVDVIDASNIIVKTDVLGIATCDWRLGPLDSGRQLVMARLMDADASPAMTVPLPPINFAANLSTSDQVAYEPGCKPGVGTVHEFLLNDSVTPPNLPALGGDGYYTVEDVLNAFLCKLKAKHIPFDNQCERLFLDADNVGDALNNLCETESSGCCTEIVYPDKGQTIQEALDNLPPEGGCVCLKTGTHKINEAIRMEKSNVVLHGESPGTRVVRNNGATLLKIEHEDPGSLIRDIKVEAIDFSLELSDLADIVTPEEFTLVFFHGGRRISIEHCGLHFVNNLPGSLQFPWFGFNIAVIDCTTTTIRGNRFSNVGTCAVYTEDSVSTLVLDNSINGGFSPSTGVSSGIPAGAVGVWCNSGPDLEEIGPNRVEGNRIENIARGIWLDKSIAAHSTVFDNVIIRQANIYDTQDVFAIDVECTHCNISNNHVVLQASGQKGGIRASGPHSSIASNHIVSEVQMDGETAPIGILLGDFNDTGALPPDYGAIRENRLTGRQFAIVCSRPDINIHHLKIQDNEIAGNPRAGDSYGISLLNTTASIVENNRVVTQNIGMFLTGGEGNLLKGNRISDVTLFGIIASQENDFTATHNSVEAISVIGIYHVGSGQINISHNRIAFCGGGGLLAEVTGGDLAVVDCEILDSGLSSDGTVPGPFSLGVTLSGNSSSSIRVSRNRIAYSDTSLLDPTREDRALIIMGGAAAIVSDNFIQGAGFPRIVEMGRSRILGIIFQQPLQKITYSNNHVFHFSGKPSDAYASILFDCLHLIALGNQVEATDRGYWSFDFRVVKTLSVVSNITSGRNLGGGGSIPSPITDFNIRA